MYANLVNFLCSVQKVATKEKTGLECLFSFLRGSPSFPSVDCHSLWYPYLHSTASWLNQSNTPSVALFSLLIVVHVLTALNWSHSLFSIDRPSCPKLVSVLDFLSTVDCPLALGLMSCLNLHEPHFNSTVNTKPQGRRQCCLALARMYPFYYFFFFLRIE